MLLVIVFLLSFVNVLAAHISLTPELDLQPTVSFKFMQSSQNIEENAYNSLDDVYYHISILSETGKINELSNDEKKYFERKIYSFRNPDGGYGDWDSDRSKAGSTKFALRTLKLLGVDIANKTETIEFLGKLQVMDLTYGNGGFRSSLKESDADVSSTYDVVYSLDVLGAQIPNRELVVSYLKDHQNFDGGFGYQTNRQAGIFWDSTLIHTRRGVEALRLLGEEPEFFDEAVDFVMNQQSVNGGFANEIGNSPRVSATFNAIITLNALNQNIPNVEGIENFIKNNMEPNGGFKEFALDTKEGIHTTYYAAAALNDIGKTFDSEKIVGFANEFVSSRFDGGFGDYPGLGSTLKSTFNAVSALNLIGKEPLNKTQTIDFILAMKNPDGGFGQNGVSNVESTYRAIVALNILGHNINDRDNIVSYLKSVQNSDGGYGFTKEHISRGSYTYRAVRALEVLGSEPVNKQGAINFLRLLQNSDGGFGNYIGESSSDLGSTYRAVRALSILSSEPMKADEALSFVKNSINNDGGFKRSPEDIVSPGNLSKAVFTYDGVLALSYLNDELDIPVETLRYIKSLRNPDLAFAQITDFTSDVSSTFTALWTYYYVLDEVVNDRPHLKYTKIENVINEDGQQEAVFSTRIYDNESQIPEYVHLVLNGEKYLMSFVNDNLKGERYEISLELPVGEYEFFVRATDGLKTIKSADQMFNITPVGDIPKIDLQINQNQGGENSVFEFSASLENVNADLIEYVKIKFNDDAWIDMNRSDGKFVYSSTFNSGEYNYKVKAYDGVNVISSDKHQFFVFSEGHDRPSWDVYEKIKGLIEGKYGKVVEYEDVSKDILNGNLVWAVDLGENVTYVDYAGDNIYVDENKNFEFKSDYVIFGIIVVFGIVILILAVLFFRKHHKVISDKK